MTRRKVKQPGPSRFARVCYFTYAKGVIVAVWIVGLYFTVTLLYDLKQDSTKLTNAAFAILASFAALSFSAARAINDSEEAKDRFTYAGERFFHGAILLITASIVKYGILSAQKAISSTLGETPASVLISVLGIPVPGLFGFALSSAHGGIKVINELLWSRMSRYSDWDNIL